MMKIAFYKGTRKGLSGIYNRLVRWWGSGDYSHVEIVFSDGVAASSSFSDGGVRLKQIDFEMSKWDLFDVEADEQYARKWFEERIGVKYDILGNVHFVLGFISGQNGKYFCSEAVGESLGIEEAWRFEPNALAALFKGEIWTG